MEAQGSPTKTADWKRHPWKNLPTWAKWVVGIVGVLFIMGIGAAIGSGGEEDALKKELAETEQKLSKSEDAQKEAEDEAQKIKDHEESIVATAESEADRIVGKAKSELSTISGKLNSKRGELGAVEGELSETEASLSGAEEEKRLSSIPGDGTFKANVDYLPGTYRSSGGNGCYWATLNSPDPFDIAANENATGPTIAPVTTPYFQTKGCGKWERIGE